MTQPDHPDTTTTAAAVTTSGQGAVEPLPPFSGEPTTCAKCSNADAYTAYRVATGRHLMRQNDQPVWRGPLPERLERTCRNCGYEWDEALAPPSGPGPVTVEDLAYALRFCTPQPLFEKANNLTARRLIERFELSFRPGVWDTSTSVPTLVGRPRARPQDGGPTAPAVPPFALADQPPDTTADMSPDTGHATGGIARTGLVVGEDNPS